LGRCCDGRPGAEKKRQAWNPEGIDSEVEVAGTRIMKEAKAISVAVARLFGGWMAD
jgi:hypothetical protein